MKKLTIESFISVIDDNELSQYYVLGALKKYYSELYKNKLYPSLSELFDLGKVLEEVINQKSNLEKIFPQKSNNTAMILKPDSEVIEKDIFFEADIEKLFEFINWAYPKVSDAIIEGKAIYSFVKQNLKVEEVGEHTYYRNEGFFIIRDNTKNMMNVYRYEIPFMALDNGASSEMKINLVKSFASTSNQNISLLDLREQLGKEFQELPNPATYYFETDLDFPFEETILPIAKRRLMKTLAA